MKTCSCTKTLSGKKLAVLVSFSTFFMHRIAWVLLYLTENFVVFCLCFHILFYAMRAHSSAFTFLYLLMQSMYTLSTCTLLARQKISFFTEQSWADIEIHTDWNSACKIIYDVVLVFPAKTVYYFGLALSSASFGESGYSNDTF